MHRYQRKLPFVDIIEIGKEGACRSQEPSWRRRRRDFGARLRETGSRDSATAAPKREGGRDGEEAAAGAQGMLVGRSFDIKGRGGTLITG